jgi:hypothetical protein
LQVWTSYLFAGFWVWKFFSNMDMTLLIQHTILDEVYLCTCT